MSYKFLGPIWRAMPRSLRRQVVRLTQPTFTISAAAVVRNEKGEILLLDHVLRPKSGWGLPGGFVDAGEQPEDAVRREVKEETGVDIENVRLLSFLVLGSHVEMLYSATTTGTPEVKSREIISLGWYRRDSLPPGLSKRQRSAIDRVLEGDV